VLWPLIPRSAWAQQFTVVAGTTVEGCDLASVRLVDVLRKPLLWGQFWCWRCLCIFELGRRWLGQPLWWQGSQLKALLMTLSARSDWAQTATVVAESTREGAALASDRLVGVGPASHCGVGYDT
jgi:hypothetical protein